LDILIFVDFPGRRTGNGPPEKRPESPATAVPENEKSH